MKQRFEHIDNVNTMACFSKCGKFRYRLTIDLADQKHEKSVCTVMQNSSHACEEFADKSVQFLEKLIFLKDYEEFSGVTRLIVVNQFAYIRTKDFSGNDDLVGRSNDLFIEDSLRSSDIAFIAWGKTNKYEKRKEIINMIISRQNFEAVYEAKKHPAYGFFNDYIKVGAVLAKKAI